MVEWFPENDFLPRFFETYRWAHRVPVLQLG